MYDFETLYPRLGLGSEKWDKVVQPDNGEVIVPLTVADMEFKVAPEIVQAVSEMADFGLWGYTHDDDSFRRAVAHWMDVRHGWKIDTNWIVCTAGIVPALYTAVRAFTQPGDGVIIQPPVYPPFFVAAKGNDRKILENPLVFHDGKYEMDYDDLAEKAKQAKMLILCSPHNPVGRVWSREELERLATICAENGVLVLSDEIHCDIIMPPNKHTAYGTLPQTLRKNSLIATSASKTFSLAGLSCSSIIIEDESLRQKFKNQRDIDGGYFNSTFGWVATKAAYEKAMPWLVEMIDVVYGNWQYLNDFLAEKIPMLKVSPLEGTYLAWVDCRSLGLTQEALTKVLTEKARLYVNPGSMFGDGGEGFIRINLACPRKVLTDALIRLEIALGKLGK